MTWHEVERGPEGRRAIRTAPRRRWRRTSSHVQHGGICHRAWHSVGISHLAAQHQRLDATEGPQARVEDLLFPPFQKPPAEALPSCVTSGRHTEKCRLQSAFLSFAVSAVTRWQRAHWAERAATSLPLRADWIYHQRVTEPNTSGPPGPRGAHLSAHPQDAGSEGSADSLTVSQLVSHSAFSFLHPEFEFSRVEPVEP